MPAKCCELFLDPFGQGGAATAGDPDVAEGIGAHLGKRQQGGPKGRNRRKRDGAVSLDYFRKGRIEDQSKMGTRIIR